VCKAIHFTVLPHGGKEGCPLFEKDLRLDWLLDFYGDVLPERTRAMMRQYYEDDLSLSEIAQSAGITRQGVRHLLKKAEEELLHLESCLGMAQRHTVLADCADRIAQTAAPLLSSPEASVQEAGREIVRLAQQMHTQL